MHDDIIDDNKNEKNDNDIDECEVCYDELSKEDKKNKIEILINYNDKCRAKFN